MKNMKGFKPRLIISWKNKSIKFTVQYTRSLKTNNLTFFFLQTNVSEFQKLKSKLEFNFETQHGYKNPLFCNPLIREWVIVV